MGPDHVEVAPCLLLDRLLAVFERKHFGGELFVAKTKRLVHPVLLGERRLEHRKPRVAALLTEELPGDDREARGENARKNQERMPYQRRIE